MEPGRFLRDERNIPTQLADERSIGVRILAWDPTFRTAILTLTEIKTLNLIRQWIGSFPDVQRDAVLQAIESARLPKIRRALPLLDELGKEQRAPRLAVELLSTCLPGGDSSWALAIRDLGAVGWEFNQCIGRSRVYLDEASRYDRSNSTASADLGILLIEANAINSRGEIIAMGVVPTKVAWMISRVRATSRSARRARYQQQLLLASTALFARISLVLWSPKRITELCQRVLVSSS